MAFSGNTPRTELELDIIANAVAWTCVRGVRSNRTVTRHATENDALIHAIQDGRTMLYAVDAQGRTAHVRNV
ncbi:hypothetical protein FDH38_gp034 [Dinoroseobacter phage vB_DshS-R5C]|uniref:Uncharacterized protein n=1 Tax=Dinoroseobacter phage vB_DshS-R5C TaxID=1965368 RepID=A0A1V0DY77_9CAUD|nr:hypothetical protein FDH38_gp034 [Dinoroseobacter phage vB_DshS-R5C]ARB06088.1 hypothetical protein vBDshSR5C_34 [Dinoroseobacter phage vB_DshS-R5C]